MLKITKGKKYNTLFYGVVEYSLWWNISKYMVMFWNIFDILFLIILWIKKINIQRKISGKWGKKKIFLGISVNILLLRGIQYYN